MAATPKVSFDFKRSVLNPKPLSFLNLINFTGHFKVEYDHYGYRSAFEKFENEEKTRLQNDEKKHQEYLKEVSDLEAQVITAGIEKKTILQTKLAHMKEHDAQHHTKPAKKPERFGDKFLSFDSDFENKFDNNDSAKFKLGNNGIIEANFVMKNLYDKNTILAGDASGITFIFNIYFLLSNYF